MSRSNNSVKVIKTVKKKSKKKQFLESSYENEARHDIKKGYVKGEDS